MVSATTLALLQLDNNFRHCDCYVSKQSVNKT